MKKVSIVVLSVLLLASMALAQQHGRQPATQPVLGTQQTFSGTVVSFTATAGTPQPTLVVTNGSTQKSFVLGPYWFLTASKFTATAGDKVTVISLSCTQCVTGDVVVSVANNTTGASVVLRDASGLPLWQNGGSNAPGAGHGGYGSGNGPMGNGPMGNGRMGGNGSCGGILPDMTRKLSVEGTVVSFTGGPGVGEPALTVATAAGNRVFVPSPYRVILDAGYTFTVGAKVAITAAPVVNDGTEEWVLITMKDITSGLELTFRDATGAPIGGRGMHRP